MKKTKSKLFDVEKLNSKYEKIKKMQVKKEEKDNEEKKVQIRYNRLATTKINRNIRKLSDQIDYLKKVHSEKSSTQIDCNNSEKKFVLELALKNELNRISNAIKLREKEINRLNNIEIIVPKKKYNPKVVNVIILTCTNCQQNIYKTYQSYLDKDNIRYSMCPLCRKKQEQKIKQDKELKNGKDWIEKKEWLKKNAKKKEELHKAQLKKLTNESKNMKKK